MMIWPNSRVAVACWAILMSMPVTTSTHAGDSDSLSLGTRSRDSFDLATYREMKKSDPGTLGLILTAMRETVFYAQKSIGTSVICASPKPIPAAELIESVDKEIASPSNPSIRKYPDNEQMAFIFVSALKKSASCD
jgi:tRNA A37 threonylcarbamoyladenosine synthetase subunit TsaC/SUA5/YrdC